MIATKYAVVSDDLRGPENGGPGRPRIDWPPELTKLVDALLAEKTVFVSGDGWTDDDVRRFYQSMMRYEGRRLQRRRGSVRKVEGWILWLQPESD